MRLPDAVRRHCAEVVARAEHVRIDLEALAALDDLAGAPGPALDPLHHHLDDEPEAVARAVLIGDAVNFGSGWFPTLVKRRRPDGREVSGAITVSWALADHHRAHGVWTAAQLRALRADELADVLGQPRDHELMALYAQALRGLGRVLGDRGALELIARAGGSAAVLAEQLAASMAMFHDLGFFKRAQIVPSDLALAGVARFGDLDELTIFADNLVPHVLRCAGVLVYSEPLAAGIDAGRLLAPGGAEAEIRAAAVHACVALAARLGLPERTLDALLWHRGQDPAIKARPRHRCRCVWY